MIVYLYETRIANIKNTCKMTFSPPALHSKKNTMRWPSHKRMNQVNCCYGTGIKITMLLCWTYFRPLIHFRPFVSKLKGSSAVHVPSFDFLDASLDITFV